MSGAVLYSKELIPFFTRGVVVKGFGRGSKELGIPTANVDDTVVAQLSEQVKTGIYYGWANVDHGEVHKMVVSIGWNPFYKNEKRTMETHILQKFPTDFYGSELRTAVLGYIRPEENYPSVDALIKAIQADIAFATSELDHPTASVFKEHPWFKGDNDQNFLHIPNGISSPQCS